MVSVTKTFLEHLQKNILMDKVKINAWMFAKD